MEEQNCDSFPICKHDDDVIGQQEFIWQIDNWSSISSGSTNRIHSDSFVVPLRNNGEDEGWWFKVLLMPRGQDKSDAAISLYLALDEQKCGAKLIGDEWSVCADFMFTLVNPDNGKSCSQYIKHRFDSETNDWGFSQFIRKSSGLEEDETIEQYITRDDQLIIKTRVRIVNDPTGQLWVHPGSLAYDSKRATGCVGLQNQGATCYMNSILQSLFLTTAFRKSIYAIPTNGQSPQDSIPLALQRLFHALTFSTLPPNTNDLTASFGWDLHESFTQHDVQEFLRVLMDDLEEKMKGTEADGFIDRLFGGRVKKVIRCLNVDFESSRSETVYDVQMPVAGCPTLKDSFDAYIARETMCGENKYMADGHGLQDAEMFNVFDRLPPVLHLILMRYRYDPYKDATVKINDRFEFPEEIDLQPYMSSDCKETDQTYLLHSVLVHSGDGHGGHYTAYIRPDPVDKPSNWLKFDDTRVTVVSKEEAMDENFGGNTATPEDNQAMTRSRNKLTSREAKLAYYKRVTNAYMLVYIRKSDAKSILCPFSLADIPAHITQQLQEEHRRQEQLLQERLLEQSTIKLSVYTPNTIKDHAGYDLFCSEPHPVCPTTPCHRLRLKRDSKVSSVIEQLRLIDSEHFANGGRLWTMAHRKNQTCRLDVVIYDSKADHDSADLLTLDFLSNKLTNFGELRLFAEPIIPQYETGCTTAQKTTINVFFKLFDPIANQLKPLHGLLLDATTSIMSNEAAIRRLLPSSIPQSTKLSYYEEVKVGRVDKLMHVDRAMSECDLQSGDIIILVPDSAPPNALHSYYDHIQSMLKVTFTPLQSPLKRVESSFEATISAKASLKEMLTLIGQHVNWDGEKIRPLPQSELGYSRSTKTIPQDLTVSWLSFVNGNQALPPSMTVTVYYELLPVTLSDYVNKRPLKFKDREGNETVLWVDLNSTILDVKQEYGDELCKPSEPGLVHVYELASSRIVKEVPDDKKVSELVNDDLLMDRLPNITDNELYIPGYLHNRDIPWGNPFMFKLIVGEPIADTKKRVATRLNITTDRELSKLAVHLARYGRAQRHDDLECILPEMRPLGAHEHLAVELPERSKTIVESAIKIKRTAPSGTD